MWAAKLAMSGLANIEPVSLLVMVYAVVLGRRSLYPIYIFVGMDILLYGIQLWNLNYLYVWAVLAFAAMGMKSMESPLGWAVLSGAFGLLFGALCAPVQLLVGGPGMAVSWWISGLPFDLAHCAGNFVMALLLLTPLRKLLDTQYQKLTRQ